MIKKILLNLIPGFVGLFAFILLVGHTFKWKEIHVDGVTILLLAVVALAPLIELIRKIKIGEFEAEIESREITEVGDKVQKQSVEKEHEPHTQEEYLNILDVVRNDAPLGLAKLRMELERFLRVLYVNSFPDKKHIRIIGLGKMIRELSKGGIIPTYTVSSLNDVIGLANRAVHGEFIRDKDAENLATIGVRLLDELRYIYREKVVSPIQTNVITHQRLDEFANAKYKVRTVVPLVDEPYTNTYILDQSALDDLLDGYEEYAEFIVSVELVENGT